MWSHIFQTRVQEMCGLQHTRKMNIKWSIDNSSKHFIKHCFKLVESHRGYCFPHLDKQTQQNTAASLQKSQPFTKCW